MAFDPQKLRADFPILRRKVRGKPLVYLDNAATTQKPRQVIEALKAFYETHNANIHRGVHTLSDEATQLVEDSRAKAAKFIGAPKPESVIFTRNATEAINLVAYSWGRKFLGAGDEIVLTELEHHSNLVPWQMLAQEKGVRLKFIPVTDQGTLDLKKLPSLLSSKTKLLSFTAASNALGTLIPVEKVIALAKSAGAKTLVDASQWTPHLPTDVENWGCDFAAFSSHKMLGPTGIGVLWGKPELLEEMPPFLGGGDMIARVTLETFTTNVLPHKFEAGTPNIADAVAFGAAVDYLSKLGMTQVRAHEKELTAYALERLAEIPGLRVYGPKGVEERGGVVSFNLEGLHAHDVGTSLDLEGVAVRAGHHCCQPLMTKMKVPGTARASFYVYNSQDDVDALARALQKTAEFFFGKRPARAKAGAR